MPEYGGDRVRFDDLDDPPDSLTGVIADLGAVVDRHRPSGAAFER